MARLTNSTTIYGDLHDYPLFARLHRACRHRRLHRLHAGPAAQQYVNLLTGGTSGVYYLLGVALSRVVGKALPEAKATVKVTKACANYLVFVRDFEHLLSVPAN